jgi:hypothetical protein
VCVKASCRKNESQQDSILWHPPFEPSDHLARLGVMAKGKTLEDLLHRHCTWEGRIKAADEDITSGMESASPL